ncbi:MAG: FAD-dependent oxidoreductase [Gemmatimonadetes bacterium]|nr:FAD-dependent oxidoreductase [Gemmatimonadota bacterium]
MTQLGTAGHPLRVAIVGSGPAGFFVAQHLLARTDVVVTVDMFERLPTPFGLVRFGVAPDHEEIKRVSRQFEKTAAKPAFRFFGNVDYGRHVALEDLRRHYHQVCFTTGAQTDRRLGIPGEDAQGSHAATEFVAWYNGHPQYRDRRFDLSAQRAAVIGVGNVAVDVARILCRTPEELATTDIADYALEALRRSRVREVVMVGRRGPVQAAFTNPELKELGELAGAEVAVRADEIALDPLSRAGLEQAEDRRTLERKLEILREFAHRPPSGKPRRLILRFLASPVELKGDASGRVTGLVLVRNRLVADGKGGLKAEPTGETEELPVGLVLRSVGYHGIPLPGLPFDAQRGVVPNQHGRVVDGATRQPVAGLYVAGWIKRGPTGVIGTNKPDALETVEAMLEDVAAGRVHQPAEPDAASCDAEVRRGQPAVVSYADWVKLDRLERERGKPAGRPRVKYTTVDEALAAIRGDGS